MGAATAMAMSGIDQALWDIRARPPDWPLYKLLGGSNKPVRLCRRHLAVQPPELAAAEAVPMSRPYKALKLRVGDNPKADIARIPRYAGASARISCC